MAEWRVKEKIDEIRPSLGPTDSILDIGSGTGVLCYELTKRDLKVGPLEIDDLSMINEVKPVSWGKT
jgi:16S rRNA A1518/A1519 N6-dimethyltransferase RsmA/KsgA/DIM1 with predicted DNA glycosylase/AP lyase activity